MELTKIMMLVCFALVLVSCGSRYGLDVTGYGDISNEIKTYDVALTPQLKKDLEYMEYVKLLDNKMRCLGWTKTTDNPIYLVHLQAGIDGGRNSTSAVPIFGQTGGGSSYTTGSFNTTSTYGTYTARTTYSPSFGMVGVLPVNVTTYTRYVTISLYDPTNSTETPVWMGKTISRGSTGVLNKVMPVLMEYTVKEIGKSTNGTKSFTVTLSEKDVEQLRTTCSVR
ncbi:MAG: DUF4136 domain-containing protein [Deferribacterales bacterium]